MTSILDSIKQMLGIDVVRNNVGNWKVNHISGKGAKDEKEWHAKKDIAATKDATLGLSIWNGESRATKANIDRLIEQGKQAYVYDYTKRKWIKNIPQPEVI